MSVNRLLDYLENMAVATKRACRFVKGMTKDEFFDDERTQHAVAMSIVIIGEAAGKIIKNHANFVLEHPQIPWDDIYGMRNRITHAYFAIDWQYVWETLHKDLPHLIEVITPFVNITQEPTT